ncbi:tripartite tricarboxylate transporter substrate-binding protein [Variovorax sp. J2P1-59]|uniref:Bug family tripartite tricarboxylate transporter substrate binding protein n=1 Tax=Variovorax flavidus TaxID=3053501 RepID=UPI002575136A|nr:tripartite tricarboxylate transporter substrate-binding protein [Variovorax sp. J2P1-59]MDM0075847.1 tripartite tricarboxylate transporter substrate-binding protein [Variovorax sp. J2P1-59]
MQKRVLLKVLALGSLLACGAASAEEPAYPSRPVTLVVGFAPGGGVDLMARYIARKLGDRLGQPVIVENKAGAGGTIGAAHVAKARPDGHTLLFTSVAHSINQSFYPSLPFDSLKDFAPVSPVATAPNGIAARIDAPYNTLHEMIAYAKANPEKVTYGAVSGSTTMYLGMAMFERAAGLKLRYIPYGGTMASVQATLAGETDLVSSGYASSDAFVQSGKLKMLAVTTTKPTHLAPNVPTVAAAANLPGFEVVNWMGILAPAQTPASVVKRLNEEIRKIQDDPESEPFFLAQKNDKFHDTPEAFGKLIAVDIARYGKIIKDTGAALK